MNGTRVALYARVSTLHGQNPEMQLAELREHAMTETSFVKASENLVELGRAKS
jgi:DNA invertase Pin-like site-specific DNA recombinase